MSHKEKEKDYKTVLHGSMEAETNCESQSKILLVWGFTILFRVLI